MFIHAWLWTRDSLYSTGNVFHSFEPCCERAFHFHGCMLRSSLSFGHSINGISWFWFRSFYLTLWSKWDSWRSNNYSFLIAFHRINWSFYSSPSEYERTERVTGSQLLPEGESDRWDLNIFVRGHRRDRCEAEQRSLITLRRDVSFTPCLDITLIIIPLWFSAKTPFLDVLCPSVLKLCGLSIRWVGGRLLDLAFREESSQRSRRSKPIRHTFKRMHLLTTSLSGRAIQTRCDGWTQIEQIYLGVVSNKKF